MPHCETGTEPFDGPLDELRDHSGILDDYAILAGSGLLSGIGAY